MLRAIKEEREQTTGREDEAVNQRPAAVSVLCDRLVLLQLQGCSWHAEIKTLREGGDPSSSRHKLPDPFDPPDGNRSIAIDSDASPASYSASLLDRPAESWRLKEHQITMLRSRAATRRPLGINRRTQTVRTGA